MGPDYRLLPILILLILLILAIYWEYCDYRRLQTRPSIQTKTNSNDIQKEYLFYSCFNYENNIYWRSIFIASTISTSFISYVLYLLKVQLKIWLVLLIFVGIFIPFYIITSFKTFHLYRNMCNKVKTDLLIL